MACPRSREKYSCCERLASSILGCGSIWGVFNSSAAAFEEDEKARLRREKAEKEGYPGRRKDAEKPDGEDVKDKAKEAPTPAAPEADDEGDGWRSAWAAAGDREGWLDENPLGVPTEREVQTTSTNGRCYRVMLVRNTTAV